jgi:alkanesulfonate monooxygenase SsuD/methylene tetrahydromethanopterin reductase-like flavin-dependent oxidoreductase (luciferase family)
MPRLAQTPHPPIIIGGHAPAAFRRAVQHDNGCYGFALDVARTAQCVAGLRDAQARYPRAASLRSR